MFQYVIITGIGLWLLRSLLKSSDKELKFFSDKVDDTKILDIDKNRSLRQVKSILTRKIKKLISSHNNYKFKIGKSGTSERVNNYQNVVKLYVLAVSKNSSVIEQLESYYIDMFKQYPGCLNERSGSAGVMSDSQGRYYLYIVFLNN